MSEAPPPKPSEEPKTFEEFLKALDDLSLDRKKPTNAKIRQDNPWKGTPMPKQRIYMTKVFKN